MNCARNCKNLLNFVKVIPKTLLVLFFRTRCIYRTKITPITDGAGLTSPTDASADHGLIGMHNVCGYTHVPVVPGGSGLPQLSSVASLVTGS